MTTTPQAIPISKVREALEKLKAIKPTEGPWHFMNHRNVHGMTCDCHAIMSQGNAGSLFTVSSNLGIEKISDRARNWRFCTGTTSTP